MSNDEIIRLNRSQLFEEAERARSEGNTEKEQNIRGLLMQQFKLLNSLSRDELAALLVKIPSEDWKMSEVICSKLDAFEKEETDAVRSMLPQNPTKEDIEKEFKRVTALISGLIGKEVDSTLSLDTLYDELSAIDSPYIESALAAVDWWINTLSNPDKDEFYEMGDAGSLDLPVKPEAIDERVVPLFKVYLLARVLKVMETSRTHTCTVSAEYGPNGLLSDVAKITGLKDTDFPFKTATVSDPEKTTTFKYDTEELIFSKGSSTK